VRKITVVRERRPREMAGTSLTIEAELAAAKAEIALLEAKLKETELRMK
jgi:hypothetical protein